MCASLAHATCQRAAPLPPPLQLGEFLTAHEQRALLARRDYILRYLDELVERQGYAATVVE